MKPWLLRLHRWIALAFSIPLGVLIVTGLLLSLSPILFDTGVTRRSLARTDVEAMLATFDADQKATSLSIRAYEGTMTLSAGRGSTPVRVDLASKSRIPASQWLWSDVLTTTQRLHETFLLNLGWLVTASTIAMLTMMALGVGLGWGNFRQSLGGWHRATAWFLLPLLVLSPLTGLALALRITLAPAAERATAPAASLHEAVRLVADRYDLANVVWIRPLGPNGLAARVYDNGRAKVFAVSKSGLMETPPSWPRLLHEGVWRGVWSGGVNLVTSLAFVLLLATGLTIWSRRQLQRARRART